MLPQAEQHLNTVLTDPVQIALDFAMLQFVQSMPTDAPNQDSAAAVANRITGAKMFRAIFESLAEKKQEPKPEPVRFNHRDK